MPIMNRPQQQAAFGRLARIGVVLALTAAACASKAQTPRRTGPGPVRAAARWLQCHGCERDSKELKAVRSRGERAVPTLQNALLNGPTPVELALVEESARNRFEELEKYALARPDDASAQLDQTEQEYIDDSKERYAAGYRVRAATALGEIGGPKAREALCQGAGSAQDDEYLQETIDAAVEQIPPGVTCPTASPLPTP